MDQEVFVGDYFGRLCRKAAPHGYKPDELVKATWAGTAAMVKNDGSRTNEEAFWKKFTEIYGEERLADKPMFEEFYENEFDEVKAVCGFDLKAAEIVALVKAKGMKAVLATNPLFPHTATELRIRWAGLNADDFELYTTYENSHYCKPNPDYYREIIAKLGADAEECMMVGNDASEDMAARELGMDVFLLTDCLINKENVDINAYPHGGFDELREYINRCN